MIRRIHGLPIASLVLAAIVLVVAVTGHAGVWYFISRHLGLSSAVASALMALAVIKHVRWIVGAVPC